MPRVYYNEHDEFAAAWLFNLMMDGLIPAGDIDTRSIEDVLPADLDGYTQCHFFAGIGIWALALQLAGWGDRPIWTGSCPCQPFSAAGKGGGFADERHLWPAFNHLVGAKRPVTVVGEQVASKDGLAWLDLVQTDMEVSDYAFGAVDTCAAGFGAPHIRQRLYWLADAHDTGPQGRSISRDGAGERAAGPGGVAGRLADAQRGTFERHRLSVGGTPERVQSKTQQRKWIRNELGDGSDSGGRGQTNGLWRDVDWLGCRDGKWRPVEPGTFPLADGRTFRNRVAELRGAGNALNVSQAQGFIETVMDVLPCA